MRQIFHKRAKKKRTGLFWRTLVSYTIVLVLPILICSFYYFPQLQCPEGTKQDEPASYPGKFCGADQFLLSRDAINLGSHLQLNKYVTALSNNKSTINSTPPMDRYYLKKDLASLQVPTR